MRQKNQDVKITRQTSGFTANPKKAPFPFGRTEGGFPGWSGLWFYERFIVSEIQSLNQRGNNNLAFELGSS